MRIITLLLCMCLTSELYVASVPTVTWDILKTFDYQTQHAPASLKTFLNKPITIAGFIVPLELDETIDTVKEFVLVPNPLACVHIPPPPPNQMILVTMKHAIPLDMDFRGVSITGILKLARSSVQEKLVGYELVGTHAVEANIEFDDPFEELLQDHLLW